MIARQSHHTVIADLIRNPEVRGGAYQQAKTTGTGPSYWLQGSIHRVGCDASEQAKTTARIPSPLMGEESKVRVTPSQPHHRVIPSKARNLNPYTPHTRHPKQTTQSILIHVKSPCNAAMPPRNPPHLHNKNTNIHKHSHNSY